MKSEDFDPVLNLMVYKSSNSTYAEIATITNNVLNAYKPVSPTSLKSLYRYLVQSYKLNENLNSFSKIIPDKVFMSNENCVGWRIENMMPITLKTSKEYLKRQTIEFVKLPNLIFIAALQQNYLAIAAYEKWEGENTILYYPPTFNTYSNGSVCLGNLKTLCSARDTYETYMYKIQKGFFDSYGTHDHSRCFADWPNSVDFWEKAKKPVITTNMLIKNKTLSEWVAEQKTPLNL